MRMNWKKSQKTHIQTQTHLIINFLANWMRWIHWNKKSMPIIPFKCISFVNWRSTYTCALHYLSEAPEGEASIPIKFFGSLLSAKNLRFHFLISLIFHISFHVGHFIKWDREGESIGASMHHSTKQYRISHLSWSSDKIYDETVAIFSIFSSPDRL